MKLGIGLIVVSGLLVGCSVGDAPAAMTPEETKEAVAKLPPKEQIDYINRSPLPAAEKEKRIADIKAKAGM